jgi:hypothetical protein
MAVPSMPLMLWLLALLLLLLLPVTQAQHIHSLRLAAAAAVAAAVPLTAAGQRPYTLLLLHLNCPLPSLPAFPASNSAHRSACQQLVCVTVYGRFSR